ncbi:alpha-galactosidase [Tropicimonas aquimaris]|uniref:Alpha-galactosidase n=1 Tax=Tropicimonas aquimaris TaxID=914152 RepID=A0ABW3IKH9_9RHOB
MTRTWRLDTPRQTLVLGARSDRLAEVIYWGANLPENEDLAVLVSACELDVTGGMIDRNPDLSICPETSRTFPGQPGMEIAEADGTPLAPAFRLVSAEEAPGRLTLSYADSALGLRYSAHFETTADSDMIAARAAVEADRPLRLNWLAAPVLPAPQNATEMIDFAGRWIGEFRPVRTPWDAGIRMRDNRTGRTDHAHFPGLILPCVGATNTMGAAYALHYGWSGGHRMLAEELPDGRRQVQFGHAAHTEHAPATRFETSTLYATFSDTGLNGCATSFQRHLRDHLVTWPHPERPRPVHYNCWEAIYFDHDIPTLRQIADRAAALGAERFVLDDGWFGLRDDDTSSLGDWAIDPRKYPEGLGPLIDHIHGLGMTFGIWFEPEMVNEDSDLFRAHPDWRLGPAEQIPGRQQMVLDMAREDVRDHLFGKISAVLGGYAIDYVKWDHNRVLPAPDAAQARGFYALLDRLRAAHPDVEFESCSSGGGRIDFGVMRRAQRVWLSDSNDALERMRIQHEAALFLPLAVTGSHVGPRHCHTSGRTIDIRCRAWVAAQRHMGFEMDPRELSDEEASVLKQVTGWWKANRDWMRGADILRLDHADPTLIAEEQLARDGSRFVVFAGRAASPAQIAPRPLQLTGLEPAARYRVDLANRADVVGLSRGTPALKAGPLEMSGAALMQAGLALPWSFPETIWVIEGQRL